MDIRQRQLIGLKNNLENIELYLKEIEQTLDILDTSPDLQVQSECRLRLAQIQQHIFSISCSLSEPETGKTQKLTS